MTTQLTNDQSPSTRRPAPMCLRVFVPSCLVLGVSAFAQSGGGYTIKKSTIDSGGATMVTGGGYRLGGTVGQHDVGELSGTGYDLRGGFWPEAAPSISEPIPTVSEWGLAVLALLILTAATLVLRQHRQNTVPPSDVRR